MRALEVRVPPQQNARQVAPLTELVSLGLVARAQQQLVHDEAALRVREERLFVLDDEPEKTARRGWSIVFLSQPAPVTPWPSRTTDDD